MPLKLKDLDTRPPEHPVPVPGYRGYFLAWADGGWVVIGRRGRALRLKGDKKDGRPRVCLFDDQDKKCTLQLGRIVLLTLVGPPPFPGAECCHGDGDPCNNELANLRWDTRSANALDAIRHGVPRRRGEDHPFCRISAETVESIRGDAQLGHSHRTIARRYGISKTHVGSIIRGRKWAHAAQTA